jgi:hypothetical protein
MGALLTSQVGRQVLAEVLEAASAVLRRVRDTGQQVTGAGKAAMDTGSDTASKAVDVSTEALSGAIETSGEIASAAAGMVQAAAGSLATIASSAVDNLMPESAASRGTDAKPKRRGRRKGS